jgi:hypothetical protein
MTLKRLFRVTCDVLRFQITVNAIAAGAFESKMMKATLDRFGEIIRSRIPLKRVGTPEVRCLALRESVFVALQLQWGLRDSGCALIVCWIPIFTHALLLHIHRTSLESAFGCLLVQDPGRQVPLLPKTEALLSLQICKFCEVCGPCNRSLSEYCIQLLDFALIKRYLNVNCHIDAFFTERPKISRGQPSVFAPHDREASSRLPGDKLVSQEYGKQF